MIYGEGERAETARVLLKEAGFTVSEICFSRPSCFDFVARKNGSSLLLKLLPDIDSFCSAGSAELVGIAGSVRATPLLISKSARDKPLEDDTVYSRHDVSAITYKTYENMVLRKIYPLIQTGPGGYYVEIDGNATKRRRQEMGLSMGDMAKLLGFSRRTLYGYEKGMAKASVSAAYNLINTLGIPVAKPINVFERQRTRKCAFLATAKRMLSKNRLLTRILQRSKKCNVVTVKKAPFDFVITVPNSKMRVVGGVTSGRERDLDRRVEEILSVSRILEARSVLIGDKSDFPNKDISCIDKQELSRIKDAEDLVMKVT